MIEDLLVSLAMLDRKIPRPPVSGQSIRAAVIARGHARRWSRAVDPVRALPVTLEPEMRHLHQQPVREDLPSPTQADDFGERGGCNEVNRGHLQERVMESR